MTEDNFSLKETLDDNLLTELKKAKKQLHQEEKAQQKEEEKRRQRERKEREKNKTFAELLDEYGFGDIPNK